MLEIKNVSVRFSADSDVQAVDDVTLTVNDGEKLAIVGETGSGKSVLLLAILGLLPESAVANGEVLLNGENLMTASKKRMCQIRGAQISYIPQGGGNSMNPLMRTGYQAGEALIEHKGFTKMQAVNAAVAVMKRLNLGNEEKLARQYPHTFSGGMRQRAMIAMGVCAGADMILADEPTKGLDNKRVALVTDSFRLLEKETLLCVTHDLNFAREISSRLCVMYAAQQIESGPTGELLKNPLHPYLCDMLAAIPENGMECHAKGFAVSHEEYDSHEGCRYRARCRYADEKCKEKPPVVDMGNHKVRCWKYAK